MNWARIYHNFSERFGWLPKQISKLTLEQVHEYLAEIARIDKMRAKNAPKIPRMPTVPKVPRR